MPLLKTSCTAVLRVSAPVRCPSRGERFFCAARLRFPSMIIQMCIRK
jgi:hypothetical protein